MSQLDITGPALSSEETDHAAGDLAAGAVALRRDRGRRQPRPAQHQRRQGRRAPVVVGVDGRHHGGAVVPRADQRGPGLGQAARLAGAARDQLPARRPRREVPADAARQGRPAVLPLRLKDPDTVDFSTGSVGIGATAALWAAISHRYVRSQFADAPPAGRFISLLGDAELDEGAIWEAVADPQVAHLGELLWVVDLNRQSLDRVVPDIQIARLQGMFEAGRLAGRHAQVGPADLRAVRPAGRRRAAPPARGHAQRGVPADAPRRLRRGRRPDHGRERYAAAAGAARRGAVRAARRRRPRPRRPRPRPAGRHVPGRRHPPAPPWSSPTPSRAAGCPPRATPTTTRRCSPRRRCRRSPTRSGDLARRPLGGLRAGHAPSASCAGPAASRCVVRRSRRPPPVKVPTALGHPHRKPASTQAALGRLLADLKHDAPEAAARVVTCSPDVASSTNLGGWINKTGVWSVQDRPGLVRRRHANGS